MAPKTAQEDDTLPSHVDELLTHVQRNLDPGQIDTHFVNENMRHANAIDLIDWEELEPATLDRFDQVLPFEREDKILAY